MKRHIVMNAEPGRYRSSGREDRAVLGATYTGRSIAVGDGYIDAKAWRDAVLRSQPDRGWRARFEALLERVPIVHEPTRFWRGRVFPEAPSPEEPFGPPPPERAASGRYNEKGQPALYLSTSVDGVIRELCDRSRGSLWVRRFAVPLPSLYVADFTSLDLDSFEAAVFWLSERDCGLDKTREEFRFSRLIAQLVGLRFEGMLVPGVRGGSDLRYSNLVLFRPGAGWRDWQRSRPSIVCPAGVGDSVGAS